MTADLGNAVAHALTRDRRMCAAYAARFSWPASARHFIQALTLLPEENRMAA